MKQEQEYIKITEKGIMIVDGGFLNSVLFHVTRSKFELEKYNEVKKLDTITATIANLETILEVLQPVYDKMEEDYKEWGYGNLFDDILRPGPSRDRVMGWFSEGENDLAKHAFLNKTRVMGAE